MDPWSKGDYSRHIQESLMVVAKLPEINPPSGRVSGQVRRALPILESPWQRNREEYREKRCLPRVSVTGWKYRLMGAPGMGPSSQAPSWHGQEWGRSNRPPRRGVAPLCLSFGLPESFVVL